MLVPATRRSWVLPAAALAGLAAVAAATVSAPSARMPAVAAVALATLAVAGYLAWHVHPAWMFSGALALSAFNNNWDHFGFPGGLAPDRFLLVAALGAVLLRAPPVLNRPELRERPLHALMALTLAWAVGSAIAHGTLGEGDTLFTLLDRLVMPFAVLVIAPLIFTSAEHRKIFLTVMVGFATYVGLTTLFEGLGLRALVFPRFILDQSIGYHAGRGRGPFLEAPVNGMALVALCTLCILAARTFVTPRARMYAAAIAGLCAIDVVFTLTRAAWLAAVLALVVTLAAAPELRRWLVPAVVAGALAVVALFAVVPGLDARVSERSAGQRSVWERQNVNAAAVAMLGERPLVGYGLGRFNRENADHFVLLDDTPQIAQQRLAVHNVFLGLGVELGLIGLTLFLAVLAIGVGGPIVRRGPPAMRPWRWALLAITVAWAVSAMFAPLGHVFAGIIVWAIAGIVTGGREDATA